MNYRVVGKGPAIVLIHGFGVSFKIWKNIEGKLAKTFRIVIVELPGIGRSELGKNEVNYYEWAAEELENLRKLMKLESWTMVAYSAGTRVVEKYVRKYGQKTNKIALICPAFATTMRIRFVRAIPSLAMRWLLTGWRMKVIIWQLGFNGRWNKDAEEWLQEIGSQKPDVLKRMVREGEFEEEFKMKNIESLLIWGKFDRVSEIKLDMGTMDIIVDGGHSLPVEKAEDVVKAVGEFLEQ